MKKCKCGAGLRNDTYGDRCEDCFALDAYWFDGDPKARVPEETGSNTSNQTPRPHRSDRRQK